MLHHVTERNVGLSCQSTVAMLHCVCVSDDAHVLHVWTRIWLQPHLPRWQQHTADGELPSLVA